MGNTRTMPVTQHGSGIYTFLCLPGAGTIPWEVKKFKEGVSWRLPERNKQFHLERHCKVEHTLLPTGSDV